MPRGTAFWRWILLPALFLWLSAASVEARDPGSFAFGLGAFAFDDQEDQAGEARIEYRPGVKVLDTEFGDHFRGVGPMVGLMANTDGGIFGYGGVYLDLRITERILLRPSAGIGGYREGGSRDLGGVFQFHIGASLAYRFEDSSSLGISFAHISNASVHDRNPGVNSLLLTYTVPLDNLLDPR